MNREIWRSREQVLAEAVLLLVTMSAIRKYSQDSEAMTVYMVAILLVRQALIGQKGDGWFLLLGLLLGGGNDVVSMVKGVYRYSPDHWLKENLDIPIPPWMILFWGQVFLLLRHVYLLPAFKGDRSHLKTPLRAIMDGSTWAVLRGIIYKTVRSEPLPTLGYSVGVLTRLFLLPPEKNEWRLMAVAIFFGPWVEAELIRSNLYEYDDPVLGGMPAWLLIYWSFAIPLLLKGVFDRVENCLVRV